MDLTEIIQEVFENYPEKMVVDISEHEDENHQTYKFLYENIRAEKQRLEEENFTLSADYRDLERDFVEMKDEVAALRQKLSVLSESLLPAMDGVRAYCSEKIFVSNIKAGSDKNADDVFDLNDLYDKISDHPGVYGNYRPSWFTPLQQELNKKSVQKKNISSTSGTFLDKIMFWKSAGSKVQADPEAVSDEYDRKRKENILELLHSDCSNEEKYLKYALLTPNLDSDYLKMLDCASEMNINAKLLISLLEQPNDRFNRKVMEVYMSSVHKGTEYNLKQELAEELIEGKWFITLISLSHVVTTHSFQHAYAP